jgi:hypothetical protein
MVESRRFGPQNHESRANCNRNFGWMDSVQKNAKRNKKYMKRPLGRISSRSKKIACTVSAAALMLGVSSAATVGLHFMENYSCRNAAYSGYPITLNAFGIAPSGWENLMEMENGYGGCPFTAPGYTLEEVIDSTTSTNGLNPLPNGSLDVTWFGNSANVSGFGGYEFNPPHYAYGGAFNENNPKTTGEAEVYATFIRDGINYGPPGASDNPLKDYYSIDVVGLKSLFTNTPFVVELMASADSMDTITNAFIIDVADSITNSVTYPGTPPVQPEGGTAYLRGEGGGLSTGSAAFTNVDEIKIISNIPQHGGSTADGDGFNNGGTISGFIITDKPVVSMSPQSEALASVGDTVALSAYAIGVPPLSYQWRLNGQNISGANATNYSIPTLSLSSVGNYDLVVTNLYGSTTSKVSSVGTGQVLVQSPTPSNNIVYDSNPDNSQHDGINKGASWLASSTGGTVTRTGVMSFDAEETNGISVPDNAVFDGTNGTITFWMQSSGTDVNANGSLGASLFGRTDSSSPGGNEFILVQQDSPPGSLEFFAPNGAISTSSSKNVSDNKWHFVALSFNQGTNGFADVYIDGALDSTNANNGPWTWPSGPLQIGYSTDSFWRAYNGNLDGIRYYSAVLNASQISSIYSSGNSDAEVDPADLQLEFDFTTAPGEGLILSWQQSAATLESAPTVTGPWTPVPVSSPYTIVPTASQQFFRYIYTHTPQSLISNPWLM